MSDLISRQAVIDRINKLIEVEKKQGTDDWGYGRERVNAYEAMLHFVKSEYLYPSVEPEKCSDCISRQAARNALLNKGQHSKRYKLGETWELNLMEIEDALWELPSVEPERKVGKWIWEDGNIPYCSNCKKYSDDADTQDIHGEVKFCSHCGSLMEDTDVKI